MIHFDLDDRYQDENVVGHAIPRREGIFLSMVFHGLLLAAILYLPQIPFFRLSPEELERRRAEIEQRLRDEQQRTFVFVQPLEDLLALQPPLRAPLSDQDRIAQAPDEAPESENPEPLVLGNSDERVEAEGFAQSIHLRLGGKVGLDDAEAAHGARRWVVGLRRIGVDEHVVTSVRPHHKEGGVRQDGP